MKIEYDAHLVQRLTEREIPESWPRQIIEQPNEQYSDIATGLIIAIASRFYKDEERKMAVSYAKIGNRLKAITIHPVIKNQIRNRVSIGRWIRIENNRY